MVAPNKKMAYALTVSKQCLSAMLGDTVELLLTAIVQKITQTIESMGHTIYQDCNAHQV